MIFFGLILICVLCMLQLLVVARIYWKCFEYYSFALQLCPSSLNPSSDCVVVFHYSPINWFKCLTSKIYHAPCRFPVICRCPMRRYMNASPRFSRTVVFVLVKKSSALETCTSINPCFPSVIINICSSIHFFYLFLKGSLWGCII